MKPGTTIPMSATDNFERGELGEKWADSDELRTSFTLAMSRMYREEVPLYGALLKIVEGANNAASASDMDPQIRAMRFGAVSQSRLDIERHGAIRLGTAKELATIRKVFVVLGLHPVGYYDLSEAGLPMHATCFRPITKKALDKNPFRVFTSVLRPELIKGDRARALAEELTAKREIFSEDLWRLLDAATIQAGRLTVEQGVRFVTEALRIFEWQGKSIATEDQYSCLQAEHPVLADICCFGTSHINHLTPRTLDISRAQRMMEQADMDCKDRIEGPPPRACPILLRQTSFLAIEESITYRDDIPEEPGTDRSRSSVDSAGPFDGCHRARFGEIEERGAAVTQRGRALYDDLTHKVAAMAKRSRAAATSDQDRQQAREEYDRIHAQVFTEFPDDWETLRRQELVYFSYRLTDGAESSTSTSPTKVETITEMQHTTPAHLSSLLANGTVEAVPITYEDFLPLSAAGIFQSNISSPTSSQTQVVARPDVEAMECAMQGKLLDSDLLYSYIEEESLQECGFKLGLKFGS